MVTFSYLNLARDAYPSLLNNTNGMDIIFCRNVVMYFTPKFGQKVIKNLHHSLIDKGWLSMNPVETHPEFFLIFNRAKFPGTALYQKGGGRVPFIPLKKIVKKPLEEDIARYPKPQIKKPQKGEITQDYYQQALNLYNNQKYRETK